MTDKSTEASDRAVQPEGVTMIATERQRQMAVEGWTPEHDDVHDDGQMLSAAIVYAERVRLPESFASTLPPMWPWAAKWWKPSADPIRNLVKAGALIAAEIDRLQRLEPSVASSDRAVKEPDPERVLPIRDAAEFAFRAVADTLLSVLLELPNRYGDNHTIDRRIAIAATQKMKADALRAIDSAILNGYLGRAE